jgi:hypothetical protein
VKGNLAEARLPEPCPDVERLSALLDGDVDSLEMSSLNRHVEACPRCQGELRELRTTRDGLRSLGALEPPPELFAMVAGAVERRRRRSFWLGTGLVGGLCGAALAAGLLLASRVTVPMEPPLGRPPSLRASAEAELGKAEHHYRNALVLLEALVAEEKPGWPARRQRAFEADIKILDQAVQESRELATRVPQDAALREVLFASYRAQLDYLREVLASRSDDAI